MHTEQIKIEKKQIFFENLLSLAIQDKNVSLWSLELINQTEKNCGFPENYHRILFQSGKADLALNFENWLDDKMLSGLKSKNKPEKIREQISQALRVRIIELVPKHIALQISSFFLLPNNLPAGSKAALSSCDVIWRYAGDTSTDFNYYTKRSLLLSVYLAAKTHYLGDDSVNYQETKIFIDKSLNNIIKIAGYKKYIQSPNIRLPKLEDIPILRLFS